MPWAQKGDSVDLPLGTSAPVMTSAADQVSGVKEQLRFLQVDGTVIDGSGVAIGLTATTGGAFEGATSAGASTAGIYPENLYADLSGATAATINQLRQAFQIQKLLERDARGGTRYTEIVKAHFGVTSPDARLQRPEYLGGGSTPVNISPVPQTSQTATTPQGTVSGYGTVAVHNNGFTKSFTEHGVIIGLVSVRADLTYQQGLHRSWSRATRYDFFWPVLQAIGEQTILNKEIFWQGDANDELVFGYQERFAEYRYKPSQITGILRSDAAGTLDAWHLSQDFSSLPVLDATFITDAPPIDRVIAVNTEPHFIFDGYFALRCARPMPTYGVPGMIDHF